MAKKRTSVLTDDPWDAYAAAVMSGERVECLYVRQAVERFLRFRSDERMEFRPKVVRRVVKFFTLLRHFQGEHARRPFRLMPWQQFMVAAMYGFYWRDTGRRVTRRAYIEMARKQGKTAFAAGLCLYHEVADGEAGAEVMLAANSRDQAKVAFAMCAAFAKGIDHKGQLLKVYRDRIDFNPTNSSMKVLAADSTKLDGPNPSMFLLDEYHAAKDSSLKDVLQSGQGMRAQPMQVIITTAGFDKAGPCYKMREMATEVLADIKTDDSLFAIVYTLDDADDWRDETVWAKSSPNLGVTVQLDYLREQVNLARNSPSEEVGVKTKNLNLWCDAADVWIPDHYLISATRPVRIEDYEGRECYVGIDLSSTSDLTAVAFLFPEDDGRIAARVHYYLPEAALKERRFKERYNDWRRRGLITITPGNVTDYNFILKDLCAAREKVYINAIGYDTWNATQFTIDAEAEGFPMQPYSQAIGNFNRPTKELERLILSGRAAIDDNEVNRICFRNVQLTYDKTGNVKPSKQSDENKVDGVIAILMALGVYLVSPRYGDFI